jgi:hypothetical protein
MRNGIIVAIGAGLLAVGGTTSAQIVTGSAPPGPAPGSGDSGRITSDNREMTSEINQRMGSASLVSKSDQRQVKPRAVAATAADIKAGAALRDIKGVALGTIVSIDGEQAVVDTGQTKIGVPLIAFGKDDKGLLLGMTADKFNQLVAAAHAKSQGSN